MGNLSVPPPLRLRTTSARRIATMLSLLLSCAAFRGAGAFSSSATKRIITHLDMATTTEGATVMRVNGDTSATTLKSDSAVVDINNGPTSTTAISSAGGTNSKKSNNRSSSSAKKKKKQRQDEDEANIATALQALEKDMAQLDDLASMKPQLSKSEVGMLIGSVVAGGIGPILFPGTKVAEVMAPAAAAFSASITIWSEFLGRVAVADGKEIAANTVQCAAEAEALLANAERVKAISPLCVGVGATGAALALLTPRIVDALGLAESSTTITEIYLLCPVISVLAAAVANLALEETRSFSARAIKTGVRRFSKSKTVGRTWFSTSEQIRRTSQSRTDRWWLFSGSVLPAPIIGSFLGGPSLSAKCIVVAALAASQSALYLAQAESVIARAQDAVALKARSAAVCETYANQGLRNSAILPYTSALSALCGAAAAAAVELPFLHAAYAVSGVAGEVAAAATFPALASSFAAAGAVSRARCQVDAEATAQAASALALEYDGDLSDDPVLRPFQEVWELVKLAVTSGWSGIKKGVANPFESIWRIGRSAIVRLRWRSRNKSG